MLLEGSLKLLCSVVVVLVGWFVAHRKWRQRAARMEEIRMRMAFAREEALRVELEEAAGYISYGSALAPEPEVEEPVSDCRARQFQHQCNVCFRPTITRCKQCKAVHYCSRKCQTLHWRQGHKDECHLFIPHKNTDSGHSYLDEFKQDEIQSKQDVTGSEVEQTIEPVEPSTGIHISNPVLHKLSENSDSETRTNDDGKRTVKNVKAPVRSLPSECSPSNVSAERSVVFNSNLKDCNRFDRQSTSMNVVSMKPLLSVHPSFTNPEYHVAASSTPHPLNSGCSDTDKNSDFSTSSSCSLSVSEEDSFSEPSTPSDCFVGTVETIRSKIDTLDETGNINMLNSCSPFLPTSGRNNDDVTIISSEVNKDMGDDLCPAKKMPKKSTVLSEVSEDGLKSGELPTLNCKLSSENIVRDTPAECRSQKEARLSPSNACGEQTGEGHVSNKHVAHVGNLSSLAPKQLHHEVYRKDGILGSMKRQENDSLRLGSSEAHLPNAYTRKPAVQDLQSVENGFDHGDAARSLGSNGYVHSGTSGTNPSARRPVGHLRASHPIKHGSLGAGSGIVERYEGSFSYEHFVKLYNWNMVALCPRGLKNCGNSCYANAVLQCLAFTPPLTAYFFQGLHSKACRKDRCFTCDFETLVKNAKEGNSPLSPARIISQIQQIGSHLGNGREEDAHEFLRYAIEAMQSVCLKDVGVNVPSSMDEETTLLGLTFGGYLQSKIECMRCGGRSRQHERIMDLTVEIGGEIGILEDALRQFTQPEVLDGDNKYHCGRCKSYEKAKKKLGVLVAPNVLTIVLKRFQSGKFGKLNKAVKYPKILNLGSYMSGTSDKFPVYQLYGVVVHIDVMNATFSGHYVCYIKNNCGKWYKADDSSVQPVDIEKVLSSDAYMLFYARCSPRAPKLLRSSVIKTKRRSFKPSSHPWENVSNSGGLRSSSLDTLSEYSSLFSDTGSYSTEESSKQSSSISTDDSSFDQLGCENLDLDRCYSSDDETTTSSSGSVNISSNVDG